MKVEVKSPDNRDMNEVPSGFRWVSGLTDSQNRDGLKKKNNKKNPQLITLKKKKKTLNLLCG